MRFTHIDVNFDVKYEGHQNCSKTLSMHILRVFGHHHMWCQNWCQYVWTSCEFIFLWTSSIVHVFDFLTFDIFLTTWHFFDIWATGHMGKGVSWLILKIEMGYLGGWGTWVMGHMGNWAHNHNFLILIGSNIGSMISSTCSNVLVWNLANISVITWTFS